MLEQAFIDGLTFALEQRHLHGELGMDALPRLDDVLFDRAGGVTFDLTGSVDRHGKAVLSVEVRARLPLICQRCLGRLDYDLERKSRLILIAAGGRLPDVGNEDPETEAIPADAVANIPDLIEQEVLLGLPLAPSHPDGTCEPIAEAESGKRSSPFAVLAGLKTS